MRTSRINSLVKPNINYDRLDFAARRKIVLTAAKDTELLQNMRSKARGMVLHASKKPYATNYMVDIAVIFIINHIRRSAIDSGKYNEWDKISRRVMVSAQQPRPFFAELRAHALRGFEPIVFTVESPDRQTMQKMRAVLHLPDETVEIIEFWADDSDFQGYPQVRTVRPTVFSRSTH